jgi:predicted enzyme related to lactoylglutathione lyase
VVSIANVVVDCYDAPGLAQFWAAVLGTPVSFEAEEYVVLAGNPAMAFQTVPEPTPGKNRLHIDLAAEDLETERQRLVGLGATVVEHVTMRGGSWTVLADPEGNQFCLVGPFDLDNA